MTEIHQETFLEFLFDVIINSAVIIAIFLVVQTFLIAPFKVDGNSMNNTLFHEELILVSKIDYTLSSPKRGDIIVFHPEHETQKRFFIKRIIGIPGDTVKLRGGKVVVNNYELDESYLGDNQITCESTYARRCPNDNVSYNVPEGKYFVLGDNRSGSSDSRGWRGKNNEPLPYVGLDSITGKTKLVFFPLQGIRWTSTPQTFLSIPTPKAEISDSTGLYPTPNKTFTA